MAARSGGNHGVVFPAKAREVIPSLNDRNLSKRREPNGSKLGGAGFAANGFSSSGLGITRAGRA